MIIVSSSPSKEVIDVTYHVNLGQQYRLKRLTFVSLGNSPALAFRETELRQVFPIRDGEIFNVERIRSGLEMLRKLYVSEGYINFTAVPFTDVDNRAMTVALRLNLDEGAVFRLGSLLLEGVEPAPGVGAKLLEAWKPYEGQIYSQQILENFMRENAAYFPRDASTFCFSMRQDAEHRVVNFRLDLDDRLPAN